MPRIHNFAAGPAGLPRPVLERIQDELLNWQGLPFSMLELGHRTPHFRAVVEQTEQRVRELLSVPSDYHVLFLQGGARVQFSAIPMNLLRGRTGADYLETGVWSQIAAQEAHRYAQVRRVASSREQKYLTVPERDVWDCDPDAAYFYYTENETLSGVQLHTVPDVGDVPLVSDMTSSLFSRPIDVSRYGLIFAAAQKNLGIAGISLVIVRHDLIGQALPTTPTVFDYQVNAKQHSLYATPPTFAWYVLGLMLEWIESEGGLTEFAERNSRKSAKLYQCIDQSDFYQSHVDPRYRSLMNVSFCLPTPEHEERFLQESEQAGLYALKGHVLMGGLRASLYNAVTETDVDVLVAFMKQFEEQYG